MVVYTKTWDYKPVNAAASAVVDTVDASAVTFILIGATGGALEDSNVSGSGFVAVPADEFNTKVDGTTTLIGYKGNKRYVRLAGATGGTQIAILDLLRESTNV